LLVVALLAACSPKPITPVVSKEPVSVRGWISDIEGAVNANTPFRTVETEAARRAQLFKSTNVWVDNAPYVSGGVAETGAFLLLDVPPGNATITFSAPGAPEAWLTLQNVPGNADVFVPGVILKQGSVGLADPSAVRLRVAARVPKPVPSGSFAVIAGHRVAVMVTPIEQMTDRHDYPNAPGPVGAPLAIVK